MFLLCYLVFRVAKIILLLLYVFPLPTSICQLKKLLVGKVKENPRVKSLGSIQCLIFL